MAEQADKPAEREVVEAVQAIKTAVRETIEAVTAVKRESIDWRHIIAFIATVALAAGGGAGTYHLASPRPAAPDVKPVDPDVKPAPVQADLAKLLDAGFGKLDLTLTKLADKIDAMNDRPLPLPIDPDRPAPLGTVIDVKATAGRQTIIKAATKGEVDWVFPPEQSADVDLNGNKATVTPHADGVVWLGAMVAKRLTWYRIVAGLGPQPPPKPDPPKPQPTVEALSIVVIWESADSTPAVARVLKDLAFWRSLELLGVTWFQFDKDQAIVAKNGYMAHAPTGGLPFVLYLTKDGKVLRSERLPGTTAEIRATVKDLTGK